MLERKVPSSNSLLKTLRATGLSETPFRESVCRFSASTWLHQHLPSGLCWCWRKSLHQGERAPGSNMKYVWKTEWLTHLEAHHHLKNKHFRCLFEKLHTQRAMTNELSLAFSSFVRLHVCVCECVCCDMMVLWGFTLIPSELQRCREMTTAFIIIAVVCIDWTGL